MENFEREASKEIIDSMQYGVINKLTKKGNELIYNYFKELQNELEELQEETLKQSVWLVEKQEEIKQLKQIIACEYSGQTLTEKQDKIIEEIMKEEV